MKNHFYFLFIQALVLLPLNNLLAQVSTNEKLHNEKTIDSINIGRSTKTKAHEDLIDKLNEKYADRTKVKIESLNEKIKIESGKPDNYYQRGICYQRLNDQINAIADFRRAIFYNPSYLDAYISLTLSQKKANVAMNEICEAFKPALQIKLNNRVDLYHRASAESGNGFHEQAIVDLKKIISIKPGEDIRTDGPAPVEPTFSEFVYRLLIYNLKSIGKHDDAIMFTKEYYARYPNKKL